MSMALLKNPGALTMFLILCLSRFAVISAFVSVTPFAATECPPSKSASSALWSNTLQPRPETRMTPHTAAAPNAKVIGGVRNIRLGRVAKSIVGIFSLVASLPRPVGAAAATAKSSLSWSHYLKSGLAIIPAAVVATSIVLVVNMVKTSLESKVGEVETKTDGVDSKVDSKFREFNTKMDTKFGEVNTQIVAVEKKMNTKFDQVNTQIVAVEKKMDTKFDQVNTKMDTKFDQVNTKFDQVNTKITGIETKIDSLMDTLSGLMRNHDDKIENSLVAMENTQASWQLEMERKHFKGGCSCPSGEGNAPDKDPLA